MLAASAMLGAAAGGATAGGGGAGPTGPPTSVSIFRYSGNLVGVQWTNGDITAGTEVGKFNTASGPPTSIWTGASPGGTSATTGIECSCWWFARHAKNGQFSSWVRASGCILGQSCTA